MRRQRRCRPKRCRRRGRNSGCPPLIVRLCAALLAAELVGSDRASRCLRNTGATPPAPNKNTKELCGPYQGNEHYCRKAIFSDVGEVDDRGYIYNMDRAGSGLTILKLTGDALAAAGGEGPK